MTKVRAAGGLPVLSLVLVLQACGGGGGGGGGSPPVTPPGSPTADSMLLPLLTGAGELKLFDPTSPETPAVTVDTGLEPGGGSVFAFSGLFRVVAAGYDGASNDLSDSHGRYVVYARQGELFRVSLLKGSSTSPVRFSALTDVCRLRSLAADYVNPLNRAVRVETSGADADCSLTADNVQRYVRLNAPLDDSGIAVAAGFLSLGTLLAADGSMGGLLAQEGPSSARLVRHYDSNLANPVTVASLTSGTSAQALAHPNRTQRYLAMRPSGASAFGLYRHDWTTAGLQLLHAFSVQPFVPFDDSAGDDTYLYFTDGNTVRRVAHSGTGVQLLHTAAANVSFMDLTLTTGTVVLRAVDNDTGEQGLVSLPKSGAASLTTLEPFTLEDIRLVATAGTRVYYSVGDVTASGVTAVQVVESGAGAVRLAGADWGGVLRSVKMDAGGLNPELAITTVLRGQGDVNGAVTAAAVSASTGTTGPELGTVDFALRSDAFNFGRYTLLNIEIDRLDGTTDLDTYFADSQAAGSLRAVETNAGVDDMPVF